MEFQRSPKPLSSSSWKGRAAVYGLSILSTVFVPARGGMNAGDGPLESGPATTQVAPKLSEAANFLLNFRVIEDSPLRPGVFQNVDRKKEPFSLTLLRLDRALTNLGVIPGADPSPEHGQALQDAQHAGDVAAAGKVILPLMFGQKIIVAVDSEGQVLRAASGDLLDEVKAQRKLNPIVGLVSMDRFDRAGVAHCLKDLKPQIVSELGDNERTDLRDFQGAAVYTLRVTADRNDRLISAMVEAQAELEKVGQGSAQEMKLSVKMRLLDEMSRRFSKSIIADDFDKVLQLSANAVEREAKAQ